MSSIFFLLRDKARLKVFLLCLAIGAPIILLSIYAVTAYETSSQFEGTNNDKGGMDYYYRESSGTQHLPEPIARILALPDKSKATYINVSTDQSTKMSGTLMVFTPEDFSSVKNYFKTAATVVEEDEDELEFIRHDIKIRVSKEKAREDDPKQGQTKYEIRFL